MGRLYRSGRGRVTNRGDLPRFVGLLPCRKSEDGVLVYRSITEMYVAQFLDWSSDVVNIAYEPEALEVSGSQPSASSSPWPDFRIVLSGGEIEWIEAKYSKDGLRKSEAAKLAAVESHCRTHAIRFRVIYRKELERNGFIDTIFLLRRYGYLKFSQASIEAAAHLLGRTGPCDLETWRARAHESRVSVELLYHLLYQQRLQLIYRPLVHTEFLRCRAS